MSNKNILLATGSYPPESGGPATYAKILNDELPVQGVSVIVVKFSEVRKYPVGIRHIVYLFLLLKYTSGIDVIYAMDPVSVGLPAYLASLISRKPLVVKIVGDYAWEQGVQRFGVKKHLDEFVLGNFGLFVRVLVYLERLVARHASHIIVPSKYLKKIVGLWGIEEKKISVVYNASPPVASVGNKNVLRGVLKFHGKYIVSVGRLVPHKNVRGLIDAFVDLQKKGISAKLLIIGSGPEEERLRAYVEDADIKDVIFAGTLSHDVTLAYIKAADALVLNSSYEGFSHLLLESLILGTPTIATNVGGNPELIVHEKTGLLIPYGENVMLTKALVRILTDEALRTRLSANGKRAAGKYTVSRMLRDTVEVFNSI